MGWLPEIKPTLLKYHHMQGKQRPKSPMLQKNTQKGNTKEDNSRMIKTGLANDSPLAKSILPPAFVLSMS